MTEEILLEKKLTTDFTMGFELEAIWYGDDASDYEINRFFDSCGFDGGDLHGDGSLDSSGAGGSPFEWASPVLPVNLTTITKIINMYKKGLGDYFYVNDTCGLHHHISFPGISAEDMIWIMCKLALDDNMIEKIAYFNDIGFITHWSKADYLKSLKNAVETDDYTNIVKLCNTDKYSLVNVHSHKTLEWRGPRGFLGNTSDEEDIKIITDFYKVFWSFVKWMTDVLDENEINNVSRDNFNAQIKTAMRALGISEIKNFKMTSGKEKGIMSEETLAKLSRKVNDDITFMAKLFNTNKNFEQFVQYLYNKNRLGKRVELLNENSTVAQDVKNQINSICYKYIPYRMLKKWFNTLSTDALMNTSKLTFKRLLATTRLDGSSVDLDSIAQLLDDKLDYFNHRLFKKENNPNMFNDVFVIVKTPNIFKMFVQNGWLKDIADESLINSINYLTYEKLDEAKEVQMKILLHALSEKNNPEVMNKIAKTLLNNAVNNPSLVRYINLNKKQIIWLITKIKDSENGAENLKELQGVLIDSGKISGPEWNKIEKFTRRNNMNVASEEELTYDEDDAEFRNRLDNAELSDDEELV